MYQTVAMSPLRNIH